MKNDKPTEEDIISSTYEKSKEAFFNGDINEAFEIIKSAPETSAYTNEDGFTYYVPAKYLNKE